MRIEIRKTVRSANLPLPFYLLFLTLSLALFALLALPMSSFQILALSLQSHLFLLLIDLFSLEIPLCRPSHTSHLFSIPTLVLNSLFQVPLNCFLVSLHSPLSQHICLLFLPLPISLLMISCLLPVLYPISRPLLP
jgi:hypothetical protein